jgi:hydrogenase nickel incorporation protein HypA/HybF
MHELGLTRQIVDIACAHSQGRRVRRIVLEIGKLSLVSPDAVRFCFDVCAQDTVAEGASLEIMEIPGRARCRQCQAELAFELPFGRCECGGSDLEWLGGTELKIREMEVV